MTEREPKAGQVWRRNDYRAVIVDLKLYGGMIGFAAENHPNSNPLYLPREQFLKLFEFVREASDES